ncbi:MotA/TolQ/ExbB proton channel family protein [Burkholderia sp. Bp9125]|nr:MotA/TolQ/ExbB proton channel family protein [Burkholderia sp. Bp9125]
MKYGIADILNRGDTISHAIALVLVLMSVASWAVMLYKGTQLIRMRRQCKTADKRFWQAGSIAEGCAALGSFDGSNPYQNLAEAAREASDRHSDTHLKEVLSTDDWLQRSLSVALEDEVARMTSGLGVLASVGSTAPFVGLFGTVWGIYHALLGISEAGQSSLSQVAGPVGESLVMTAFGLFVAIPAVLGYNAISRGNRVIVHKLGRFRHELHAYLMNTDRRCTNSVRVMVEQKRAATVEAD